MIPSFKINCKTHGENVESFLNGNCVLCKYQKEEIKMNDIIKQLHQKLLPEIGIQPIFRECSLDNFLVNNEKQQKIIDVLKDYQLKANLLLLGNVGTGKTHLMCALLKKLLLEELRKCSADQLFDSSFKPRIDYKYIKFFKLATLKIKEYKEFEKLFNYKFLVIDEVGINFKEFDCSLMFEIIDERYGNGLPTAFVSNIEPDVFSKLIGEACLSRLQSSYKFLKFDGDDFEDYRKKERSI